MRGQRCSLLIRIPGPVLSEKTQNRTLQSRQHAPYELADRVEDEFETLDNWPQNERNGVDDEVKDDGEVFVGDRPQDNSPWHAAQGTYNTDGPLHAVERGHPERNAADEYDHDLTTDHDAVDSDKPVVLQHPFEDVEVVVEPAVVKLVEDLHPDKRVENDGVELKLLLLVGEIVSKNAAASKEEREGHSKLIDRLPEDHLPHCHGKQWCTLRSRLPIQNLLSRWVGSPRARKSVELHHEDATEETHRAKAANVSMIKLTHSSCTAFKTLSLELL